MKAFYFITGVIFVIGCTKPPGQHNEDKSGDDHSISSFSQYSSFKIRQGAHYCDQNTIKSVRTSEMKFLVKFDSSAIYQTLDPENQYDINKLWGFSEDTDNHYNSARIGWSWNNEALRLYGYVYANGILNYQEITPVPIGSEITCRIKPAANTYLFNVNGVSISLPRSLSTSEAIGYQQYPYFGGDEAAPHLITILVKSL